MAWLGKECSEGSPQRSYSVRYYASRDSGQPARVAAEISLDKTARVDVARLASTHPGFDTLAGSTLNCRLTFLDNLPMG